MKSLKFHRIVSLGLVLCMLCTLLSGLSLTAFAADQYTVTFSVPTGVAAPAAQTVAANTTIRLPEGIATPASPDGYNYSFVGWYASPIQEQAGVRLNDDATIYDSLYTVTASTTLYALYQRTETIPGYYEKTQGEPSSSGAKYLIVYDGGDGNQIALDGSKGTTQGALNTNPNYVSVTINNDQILSANMDAYAFTIRRKTTDEFVIIAPSGKYCGVYAADDTKIKVNASEIINYIEFDAEGYVVITDNPNYTVKKDRILSYNGSNSIKFYKVASNLFLYQKVSARLVTYSTTNPLGETPTPCTHNYAAVVTDPTCTAAGYTTYTCTLCGDTYTSNPVPASGHNYVAAVTTAATCTAAGVTTYTCSRCGDSYTEAAPDALGHSYGAFSSNNNGTHSKTCSRCGDVITATCDTNGANGACSVCGYLAQTGACSHNFVNNVCTECGLNLTNEFRFTGAELNLNNLLDFRYSALVPSDFSNPYVVFTFNGVDTTVTEYTTGEDGRLRFVFKGINPQCMGDNISASLHASYNGLDFVTTQQTYSVRQYCVNRLKKTETSEELRKLVTALLNYGSYAQAYMGYNTSAYVGYGSDIQNPMYTSFVELSGYSASFDGDAAVDTYWISVGLELTNGVALKYRFYAESISGLTLTLSKNGVSKTYSANEFVAVDTNVYEVAFEEIQPDEFDDTFMAFFENDDEEQLGNTLYYSVNAYIQSKQNDTNKKLMNLVRALSNYGICVEAYINSLAS